MSKLYTEYQAALESAAGQLRDVEGGMEVAQAFLPIFKKIMAQSAEKNLADGYFTKIESSKISGYVQVTLATEYVPSPRENDDKVFNYISEQTGLVFSDAAISVATVEGDQVVTATLKIYNEKFLKERALAKQDLQRDIITGLRNQWAGGREVTFPATVATAAKKVYKQFTFESGQATELVIDNVDGTYFKVIEGAALKDGSAIEWKVNTVTAPEPEPEFEPHNIYFTANNADETFNIGTLATLSYRDNEEEEWQAFEPESVDSAGDWLFYAEHRYLKFELDEHGNVYITSIIGKDADGATIYEATWTGGTAEQPPVMDLININTATYSINKVTA